MACGSAAKIAYSCNNPFLLRQATAVSELLYPGSMTAEWHFPQENATLHDPQKGTQKL